MACLLDKSLSFRRAGKSEVFENDLCRIAHGQSIRGNIGDHHAPGADNSPFTNGDPLHDVGSVSNPCFLADAHRSDIFQIGRQFGDPAICLARVAISIRYTAIIRKPDIFFDDDFSTYRDARVPSDAGAVSNDQARFVEHPAGSDRDIASKTDAIADMDLDVAVHERHLAVHADIAPKTGASRLK